MQTADAWTRWTRVLHAAPRLHFRPAPVVSQPSAAAAAALFCLAPIGAAVELNEVRAIFFRERAPISVGAPMNRANTPVSFCSGGLVAKMLLG